jgi:hypothetical protein
MRGPHVRFCERCGGVILCTYSTPGRARRHTWVTSGRRDATISGPASRHSRRKRPRNLRSETASRCGAGRSAPPVPARKQIELRAVDIDSLIGKDHPVRVIWVLQLSAPAPLRACARHHSSCVTLRLRFNLPQPGVSIIRAASQCCSSVDTSKSRDPHNCLGQETLHRRSQVDEKNNIPRKC